MGASERIEAFLVAAVCAILSIRAYLSLTNYPQLGGESLHIAHMLWGGLLMLVALLLVLSFVGRAPQWTAAVLGGFGFGTFIDEVGKFVTHDNDYFYQPAIAIMYVIFVLTYLGVRRLLHATHYRREEYLVNALQEMSELARLDLDAEEKERALRYLEGADPQHPLVEPLQNLLHEAPLVESSSPPLLMRARQGLQRVYERVVAMPFFGSALIAFFVVQLIVKLAEWLLAVVMAWPRGAAGESPIDVFAQRLSDLPVAGWGELLSAILVTAFTAIGILRLLGSRLAGYYWLRRSILVSILLGQVFLFYREQFSAIVGLLFNVSVLVALDYMIHQESRATAKVPTSSPRR